MTDREITTELCTSIYYVRLIKGVTGRRRNKQTAWRSICDHMKDKIKALRLESKITSDKTKALIYEMEIMRLEEEIKNERRS